MTASRGMRSISPSSLQLDERLAERAGVAQVAAGHDDPVGHLPAQGFEHAVHDRLLPFEAERIDAVDQVDAQLAGRLPARGAMASSKSPAICTVSAP